MELIRTACAISLLRTQEYCSYKTRDELRWKKLYIPKCGSVTDHETTLEVVFF